MRHLTHRSDANQQGIIKMLREFGASVVDLQNVGNGCPDLMVGYRGRTFLFEVKSETGKLNKLQEAFHKRWKGDKILVVRSPLDALSEILILKRENELSND